jgi:heme exporter protein CcmD
MDPAMRMLEMGGHGGFVWAAYVAAALVLVVLWLLSWRSLKRCEDELKRLETRLPGARSAGAARERA